MGTAPWDGAPNPGTLIPSRGRQCQNGVGFLDTVLVSENCLVLRGRSPHTGMCELGPRNQFSLLHFCLVAKYT